MWSPRVVAITKAHPMTRKHKNLITRFMSIQIILMLKAINI
jgi:hypothetical protein